MSTRQPVAVVTGAAAGIGLATATRFWREGCAVVLADRDVERVQDARATLDPEGSTSLATATDVTDTADVEAMIQRVEESFGRLDVLVNNAGQPVSATVDAIDDDRWRAAVDVNLHSAVRCSRAALPMLRDSPSPAVVNMASAAATVGMPGRAAYAAAKAGVSALTRTLAVEWAPWGIRVNAVAPGYIATAGFDERVGVARGQELGDRVPLGRLGRPEEIAAVIYFLATEDASYLSGQTLAVDGGLTIAGHG